MHGRSQVHGPGTQSMRYEGGKGGMAREERGAWEIAGSWSRNSMFCDDAIRGERTWEAAARRRMGGCMEGRCMGGWACIPTSSPRR